MKLHRSTLLALLVLLTSCTTSGLPQEPEDSITATSTLLFAGDVMLGRGIAPIAATDPEGLFADVSFVVRSADLAFANLESPLTDLPHVSTNPYALEAPPNLAFLLSGAGFDAMTIANNHAGDAGRPSVIDTIQALEAAAIGAVGGGADGAEAARPRYFATAAGLTVASLAFDASQTGIEASSGPGIVHWNRESARKMVAEARAASDIVVVSMHGGVEYEADSDPAFLQQATDLASWGVDVVWGHGPHVVQPTRVIDPDGDGRMTVVSTSLGNFLFDQQPIETQRGAILETLIADEGVVAFRIGVTDHADRRVHFVEWEPPATDAVLLGLDWWTPVEPYSLAPTVRDTPRDFGAGDVVDAGRGYVRGNDEIDLVVSFRRPFEETAITRLFPDRNWMDSAGRSAHLGVYRPQDYRQWWVAGSLFRPIGALAVCDGGIAVAYSELDDAATVATGAFRWQEFGFVGAIELAGSGSPACADIDRNGASDPLVIER